MNKKHSKKVDPEPLKKDPLFYAEKTNSAKYKVYFFKTRKYFCDMEASPDGGMVAKLKKPINVDPTIILELSLLVEVIGKENNE